MSTEEFLLRVFRATSFDLCDSIWWRTDAPTYAPLTIFVKCSDLFFWGAADSEPLTPENIDVFEQALKDADAAGQEKQALYGPELFCARVRKMRPQPPCYKDWPEAVKKLFDDCGPPRDLKECG